MILQKLALAIRRQDWFTVVLEVLIVIVGIFIGLQVDGWNQQRKDRVLEQEYLERLLADMNGSIEDFVKFSVWDLGRLHSQRRRWGTVEELIATGNIALIRDRSLRADILATDAQFERNGEVIDASEGRIIELADRTSGKFDVLRFYAGFPSGAAKVDYDFDKLSGDAEFIAVISNIQVASHIIFEFAVDSANSMEHLRDQIVTVLGISAEGLPAVDISYTDFPWSMPAGKNPGSGGDQGP